MARGFGSPSFSFWNHVSGAPKTGSIEQRAEQLLEMWKSKRVADLTPDAPTKAKDIFRAMVLELAIADQRPSKSVAELVSTALPKWAYAIIDPVFVFSGQGAGTGSRSVAGRRLKNWAKGRDVQSIMQTGKMVPRTKLAQWLISEAREDEQIWQAVRDRWGEIPALEKTISRWRGEADYRSDTGMAKMLHQNAQTP